MATSFIAQTQPSNAEKMKEERFLVELTTTSGNGVEETMSETGLLRISNVKRLRDKDKRLTKDFRFWMPNLRKIKQQSQQVRTKSVKFNNANKCMEYVKKCGTQRVILILSGDYIQNKNLIKNFRRCPQVAMIYRRISQEQFQQQSERWFSDSLFSNQSRLPKKIIGTRVKNLDQTGVRQLIEIAFNESLIKQLPNVKEAKEQFIDFCRSKYKNNSDHLRQIDYFEANYREEDVIKWYTKSACFVNYIVSETCAASIATNYFAIRFILHDLYMQLQKLHDKQSSMWPETLIVHRGKVILRKELNRLPKVDEYVMTRNFLSVSTDPTVANTYSSVDARNNSDQVSVIISMHIDREEVASKPIAFIKEYSEFPEEEEVLLPAGIVLRTDSYEKIDIGDSQCLVKIKMIRSKEEKKIEKKLSVSSRRVLGAAAIAAGGIAVGGGIVGLLKSLEDKEGQEGQEEFLKVIADAYESTDLDLTQQIQNIIDNDIPAMVS